MHIVLLMGVMEMMKSGGELISGLLYIECTLVAGGLGSALLPEEFWKRITEENQIQTKPNQSNETIFQNPMGHTAVTGNQPAYGM